VRRISEFPWRLGKLGGVFVVLIATGVIVYFVMTGNPQPDSQQGVVRRYYESALGGHVPPKVASELGVDVCQVVPGNGDISIVQCTVTFEGHRWQPCFGFDLHNHIVSGPYQDAGPDCDRVVYDAGRRAFVLAPAGSP
jgi:hypothetical protein